jgi:hypothetical protein
MNPSTLLPLLASLCLSLPACAGTVASSDDAPAPTGASSTAPSSATTADWTCAGPSAATAMQPHPAALGPQDTLAVHLVEAYSHSGVGGVTVLACDASDTTCSSPLARAQADDEGQATMTIPGAEGSFDGYLAITGPVMPTNLVFFDGRTSKEDSMVMTSRFYEVVVYTPVALGITATLAGVTLDPARGVLRTEAHDCGGRLASGVSVGLSTSDQATQIAYFASNGGALMPGASATDETGVAIAFGVEESGFAVREALGATAVGGAFGFARAGAVSSVVALP